MRIRVKVVNALLAFIMALSCCFLPLKSSHAATGVTIKIANGMVYITMQVTEATTGIRYVTTGLILTSNPRCTPNDSTKDECAPTSGGKYGELPKYDSSGTKLWDETDQSQGDGTVISKFTIPEKNVTQALINAGMGDLTDGGTVYISGVFQISIDGILQPTKYYTLSSIENAEPWDSGTKSDFPSYYDLKTQYSSALFPVDAEFLTDSGATLKTAVPIGNYKAGQAVTYTFTPTLTINGQQYNFIESYITTVSDPNTKLYEKDDPTFLTRNITTSIGGDHIVGVYQTGTPTPAGGNPPKIPPGGSLQGSDLDPAPSAVIRADNRDAEKFDVSLGIPSSESLYANTLTKRDLYNYQFTQKTGQKQYTITVSKTYNLTWQVQQQTGTDSNGNPIYTWEPQSDSQTVTQQYIVYRNYSYWEIGSLDIYGIQEADLQNTALPGGSVTLTPSGGYMQPTVDVAHSDSESNHIIEPQYSPTLNLGSESLDGGQGGPPAIPNEDWSSQADASVGQIQVKNDRLVFDGSTVMTDQLTQKDGPTPSSFPAATQVSRDVLYRSGLVIPPQHPNVLNASSSGTVTYSVLSQINGSTNAISDPIPGINSVTVHTPVVDYATVSDDRAHNQKTQPTAGRDALILGRPFIVTVPTSGQHRSIKGYGNRDYAPYTAHRQVYFPFDVYNAQDGKAIQAGQWIEIPAGQESMTFDLPVWVDEGNYDVLFREIAINSPSTGFGTQPNSNLDLNNYVATQDVPVEVIGRVYDFHVTDIADYNWQSVFRQADGTTPTGRSYWVGDKDIDGNPRGNQAPFLLPVGMGSNPVPGYKNVTVKTGYHFTFDLKTLGNMFGSGDGIRITPSFSFVSKNGGVQQPVDLYYHTLNNAFVKIGSAQDTEKRYVILNTPLRDVPEQELDDTASDLYALGSNGSMSSSDFTANYLLNTKSKTWVGNYDLMILTAPLRTFIGNTASLPSWVNQARANAAVQKWYGEYSLPAAPYVVPAGTDLAAYASTHTLDDQSGIFLHNGYIVVNFNIETIQNEDLDHPHLQYMKGPLDNQWKMEGYSNTFTDPYNHTFALTDGDVMMYDADQSSQDDFGSGQTH